MGRDREIRFCILSIIKKKLSVATSRTCGVRVCQGSDPPGGLASVRSDLVTDDVSGAAWFRAGTSALRHWMARWQQDDAGETERQQNFR